MLEVVRYGSWPAGRAGLDVRKAAEIFNESSGPAHVVTPTSLRTKLSDRFSISPYHSERLTAITKGDDVLAAAVTTRTHKSTLDIRGCISGYESVAGELDPALLAYVALSGYGRQVGVSPTVLIPHTTGLTESSTVGTVMSSIWSTDFPDFMKITGIERNVHDLATFE